MSCTCSPYGLHLQTTRWYRALGIGAHSNRHKGVQQIVVRLGKRYCKKQSTTAHVSDSNRRGRWAFMVWSLVGISEMGVAVWLLITARPLPLELA
jgi:hypothetical protein